MTLDLPQLQTAIENFCGVPSRHVQTLWLSQTPEHGDVRFEGGVHVFALDHHPTAPSAYVWTDETDEATDVPPKVFVVLRADGTLTAKDAVNLAMGAQKGAMN